MFEIKFSRKNKFLFFYLSAIAQQNQPEVNRLDSLASECDVTQNSPAGFGQQGPVRFQEANLNSQ